MMRMMSMMAAVAVFGSAAAAAIAQPAVIVHGPSGPAAEIIAAEKAYSDNFAVVGYAKGMRDLMDPVDGLSFSQGDPARGPAVYAAAGGNAPSDAHLSWKPVEVFVAQAGDMGASWGRFTVTDGAHPTAKAFTGRYVTVWRKAADGRWKAIMDIGNPDRP